MAETGGSHREIKVLEGENVIIIQMSGNMTKQNVFHYLTQDTRQRHGAVVSWFYVLFTCLWVIHPAQTIVEKRYVKIPDSSAASSFSTRAGSSSRPAALSGRMFSRSLVMSFRVNKMSPADGYSKGN